MIPKWENATAAAWPTFKESTSGLIGIRTARVRANVAALSDGELTGPVLVGAARLEDAALRGVDQARRGSGDRIARLPLSGTGHADQCGIDCAGSRPRQVDGTRSRDGCRSSPDARNAWLKAAAQSIAGAIGRRGTPRVHPARQWIREQLLPPVCGRGRYQQGRTRRSGPHHWPRRQ